MEPIPDGMEAVFGAETRCFAAIPRPGPSDWLSTKKEKAQVWDLAVVATVFALTMSLSNL